MKEATGELNLTVIVVIIVALLSFFFFTLLWPTIKQNFAKEARCDEAICLEKDVTADGKSVLCTLKDSNEKITCAWKG